MKHRLNAVLAAITMTVAMPALAQNAKTDAASGYPNKPVRWVVPFTPGASNDIIGRLIAGKLTISLGQQFVIDNRGGAGGLVGAETVARAQPDGYTLVLTNPGPSVNSVLLAKNPPYHIDDFSNVVFIGYAPLILFANLNFPPKNPKEMVDYVKANPGKVSWGSSGIGSSLHIALALFQAATGGQMVHVPYKGTAPALTDVVGGQIQGIYSTTVSAEAQLKGQRIKAIGIASAKRSPLLPDVPTLAESGIKDAEALVWFGMSAPVKTPRAIINKLNSEVNRALTLPDVKARLDQLGLEVQGGTPEAFDKFIQSEVAKIKRLIKIGALKPE
jgi:tripartite-type tricarboxylate transporter receptor subunit TctC